MWPIFGGSLHIRKVYMEHHELDSRIFRCVRQACLLKHISFAGRGIGLTKLGKLWPEINHASEYFGYNSLAWWRSSMELDKRIVGRSLKLRLCSRMAAESVVAQTLDGYMLEMHAEKIASVLESFTVFANRITPLIQKDPNAPAWWLNSQVLVQRRHWRFLTRRISCLVSIILDRLETHNGRKRSSLPGEGRLRMTARAAARIYVWRGLPTLSY